MRRAFLLLILACILGCGDFVWFVSFNAGPIDPNGLVVIIGEPRDPPPSSIRLIEGRIPKGMNLMPDGTVQGVPEERGVFEFTLEFSNPDGSLETQAFTAEIEEE